MVLVMFLQSCPYSSHPVTYEVVQPPLVRCGQVYSLEVLAFPEPFHQVLAGEEVALALKVQKLWRLQALAQVVASVLRLLLATMEQQELRLLHLPHSHAQVSLPHLAAKLQQAAEGAQSPDFWMHGQAEVPCVSFFVDLCQQPTECPEYLSNLLLALEQPVLQ